MHIGIVLGLAALPLLCAAAEPGKPTPLGSPGEWITPNDYPATALRGMREGTTSFVLDIDEKGAVTGCTITYSSGTGELDAATCALASKRARFQPALDQQGRPTRSTYRNRVVWQIPRGSLVSPTDKMIEFDVDPAGVITNCRATDAINSLTLSDERCEMAAANAVNGSKPGRAIHVRMRQSIEITDLPTQ